MTEPAQITHAEFLSDCELVTAQYMAEKIQAESEYAQWQAKREHLSYVEEKLNLDYQLQGTYTFHRGVTQKSMDKLFETMRIWHAHDETAPWTIYLNSGGGDVFAGNGIIDELAAHSLRMGGSHRITIKVRGIAGSMAGMILQAADHRVMGKYSLLMVHKGGMSGGGFTDTDRLEDDVEFLRVSTEWMADLFLSRTGLITRGYFMKQIERRDWWLTSKESLAVGFVDAIG